MPNVSIFQTTSFNANSLPTQSVIVDAGGVIDNGPISDPILLGYTAAHLETYLEQGFASIGYGGLVYDVAAQFPNAVYYYTITSAVTANNVTTVYADQGVKGTTGSDVIFDTGGDDIFNTGKGDDLIVSFDGANAVAAGKGDDIVFLGAGDDVVKAGGGSDYIVTQGGADAIKAGGGADTVEGGAGADLILGNGGADRLDGGADNDVLNGGNGRDTFVFAVGSGSDLIEDFQAGRDTLELSLGMGASGFGDIAGNSAQVGNDLVITLSGDVITLQDITLGDLGVGDFAFV